MPAIIDAHGNVTKYGERRLASMLPDRAAAYLAELRETLAHSKSPNAWVNQIPKGLTQKTKDKP